MEVSSPPIVAPPLAQESVIMTLSSLYDLSASPASARSWALMADWVGAAAPDDLDLACLETES